MWSFVVIKCAKNARLKICISSITNILSGFHLLKVVKNATAHKLDNWSFDDGSTYYYEHENDVMDLVLTAHFGVIIIIFTCVHVLLMLPLICYSIPILDFPESRTLYGHCQNNSITCDVWKPVLCYDVTLCKKQQKSTIKTNKWSDIGHLKNKKSDCWIVCGKVKYIGITIFK